MPSDKNMKSATPEMLDAIAREVRGLKGTEGRHVSNRSAAEMTSAMAGSGPDGRLAYEVEQFASGVSSPAHAIGRMPPEPPTFRGRIGSLPVRLVRRCLFWYSIQINQTYVKTADLFRRVSLQLSNLDAERDRQRQRVDSLSAEVGRLTQVLARLTDEFETFKAAQKRSLADEIGKLRTDQNQRVTDEIERLMAAHNEQVSRLNFAHLQIRSDLAAVINRHVRLTEHLDNVKTDQAILRQEFAKGQDVPVADLADRLNVAATNTEVMK